MSKIEEALKKAKQARANGKSELSIVPSNDDDLKQSSVRDLALRESSDGSGTVVGRKSSAKEIALMEEKGLYKGDDFSELKIIYSEMQDNKTANTYRDLRTKLIQKSQGRNFIVMLTSCDQGLNSAATTLNLATAFSFDESKTSLLIDCNLNNPQFDAVLDLDSKKGLTDYLENEDVDIESILHTTGIKRLRMIPAGESRETATEYFTSLRMRELMSNLLNRYSDRYIFINSPPVVDSADTRILTELCDFVLLVVPYGRSTKSKIKEAADAIGKDKLLGIVFNDIPKFPKFKIPDFIRSRI
jgi:protein-tyrosine kinase